MSDSIKAVFSEGGLLDDHHEKMKKDIAPHVKKAWEVEGPVLKHDKKDFDDHVDDVHKHMMKNRITDAKKGTDSYHDTLHKRVDKMAKKAGVSKPTKPEVH